LNSEIAAAIVGFDAASRLELDAALRALDDSPQLGRLGGNAILSVSVAAALATAADSGVSLYELELGGGGGGGPLLPMPMVNIVSGGAHARGAGLDVQDFLALPVGASSFAEAIEWCWRTREATLRLATARGCGSSLVADEGGVGVAGLSHNEALDLLSSAIEAAGLEAGPEVAIALDVAATQLYDGTAYLFEGRVCDAGALIDAVEGWCARYPIASIEDVVAEDDWAGWREASRRLRDRLQLVGDDLFVTNVRRLQQGVDEGVANAVLIKPNQCGTLSDARAALLEAQKSGYRTIVSARSGDTEDSWLADLAVGWRSGQIKVGSTVRSERTAKWNRLLKIEAELGERSSFAEWDGNFINRLDRPGVASEQAVEAQ
jgi:enolase